MKVSSKLKQRVTFEEPVYMPDNIGGFITYWRPVVNVWAEVLPISATTKVRSEKLESLSNYQVTIRYNAKITNKMRIKFKTKYLSILSVINIDEANEVMEIIAKDEVK